MGKSAAAALLQQRGCGVIDTDAIARELVEAGQPALQEIRETFGDRFLDAAGRLQRDELAAVVFANETARRQLEAILHPRIRATWKRRLEIWRTQGQAAAVVVIPLLFETGAEAEFEATLCVGCSEAIQRQRLRERGWTDQQIHERSQSQFPIRRKMELADYVIWNDCSLEVLAAQLAKLPFFQEGLVVPRSTSGAQLV